MLPLDQDTLATISNVKNITLQLKPTTKSLIFKVSNEDESIDIKGKIEKKDGQDYQGLFKVTRGLKSGISGANCKDVQPENSKICQINLIKKNRKYILSETR